MKHLCKTTVWQQHLVSHVKDNLQKNKMFTRYSSTYKVEHSNAHVHTALKMHLLIGIFPRAAIQYLDTLPTWYKSVMSLYQLVCTVYWLYILSYDKLWSHDNLCLMSIQNLFVSIQNVSVMNMQKINERKLNGHRPVITYDLHAELKIQAFCKSYEMTSIKRIEFFVFFKKLWKLKKNYYMFFVCKVRN